MTLKDEEVLVLCDEIRAGDPWLASGTGAEVGSCIDADRGGLDGGDDTLEEVSF